MIRRPALAPLALLLATLSTPAFAAAPATVTAEGALTSAGGGPVTDGTYPLTFALYSSKTAKTSLWAEGPVNLGVKSGRFSYVLGSGKALDKAKIAAAKQLWLEITVGTDPALPRRQVHATIYAMVAGAAESLSCTGCLTSSQLANGGISAAKVGFNYAGAKTKGGPALDLTCTGCVSVAELKFDGDVNLGGNSLKAKNGTFTGDVAAATVTATKFIGDGSQLTGIKTPAGTCSKPGEVVKGINADGSLKCVAAMDPSALPKDGLNEISNDLLSNQFVDTVATATKKTPIPDNTGASANTQIQFPDIGTSQSFSLSVYVENTDLSKLTIKVLPPDDKKTGWVLCDPCGKKDAKVLKQSFTPKAKPKSGDIGKWVGANPKGLWNLVVTDTSFCVPQAPGNKVYCDTSKKTDGWVADWSIQIQTLSNKKVEAKGMLITSGGLQLLKADKHPVACTPERFGYLYANPKDKAIYACNGEQFAPVSIFSMGSKGNPGLSCKAIKTAVPSSKSGTYWIDPDGPLSGEPAFETWCDQETDGGGWTLAVKGTLSSSYNSSLNKDLSASKGFMKAYNRVKFTDVMVRPGDPKLTTHWAVFANVGNGNETLDAKVKAGGSGSYNVDYNQNMKYSATKRSSSLASVNEWEAMSLRMSQTSGPNDAMLLVVGRKSRSACNNYNGKRTVNTNCIGAQVAFGSGFYAWSNWQTWTGWTTSCGSAGYWSGTTTGCQSTGGFFVR